MWLSTQHAKSQDSKKCLNDGYIVESNQSVCETSCTCIGGWITSNSGITAGTNECNECSMDSMCSKDPEIVPKTGIPSAKCNQCHCCRGFVRDWNTSGIDNCYCVAVYIKLGFIGFDDTHFTPQMTSENTLAANDPDGREFRNAYFDSVIAAMVRGIGERSGGAVVVTPQDFHIGRWKIILDPSKPGGTIIETIIGYHPDCLQGASAASSVLAWRINNDVPAFNNNYNRNNPHQQPIRQPFASRAPTFAIASKGQDTDINQNGNSNADSHTNNTNKVERATFTTTATTTTTTFSTLADPPSDPHTTHYNHLASAQIALGSS